MLKLVINIILSFLVTSNSCLADSIVQFTTNINLQSLTFEDQITTKFDSDNKFSGTSRTITLPSKEDSDPQILSAFRNGQPINYTSQRFNGGFFTIALRGDGSLLPSGEYEFKVKYKIGAPLRVENKLAILEWSVNSKLWKLPIQNISGKVDLPNGISSKHIKHYAYTLKDGKKDLTTGQSALEIAKNQITINYNCLKSLEPKEEFYIYVEYPDTKILNPVITADSAETIVVNGKSVKIGKSISAENQAIPENKNTETPTSSTIKVDGKEIKVGKSITLDNEQKVAPEQTPSKTVKIDGRELRIGNIVNLEESQKTTTSSGTVTPSGKKVEVGKSIRLEE